MAPDYPLGIIVRNYGFKHDTFLSQDVPSALNKGEGYISKLWVDVEEKRRAVWEQIRGIGMNITCLCFNCTE